MEDFNTEIKTKLDWSEMDLFGHINNVAYFKFIQAARVNYCELIGINTYRPEEKLSFSVAASSCRFKKPLFYPDDITIKTKVNWIKNSSFELEHAIIDGEGNLSAEGTDILVVFDYEKNSKVNIPPHVRERISSHEKRPF